MKNIVNFFLALLSFLLFYSCESPVEDAVLPFEKSLVVHGYLSPDLDINMVEIGHSSPVLGSEVVLNTKEIINNLKVTITDKTGLAVEGQLLFNPNGVYEFSFPANRLKVLKGATYFLNVTADGFPSVKSQCTVPENTIDINKVILTKKKVQKEDFFSQHLINIQVAENEVNSGFYACGGEIITFSGGTQILKSKTEICYVTPKDISAQKMQFRTYYNFDIQDKHILDLGISTLDENMYRYFTSVLYSEENESNPFSEAVQDFSNIEGGIGVFGSYLKSPNRKFELN